MRIDPLPPAYGDKAPTAGHPPEVIAARNKAYLLAGATSWQHAAAQEAWEMRHYMEGNFVHLARMRQRSSAIAYAHARDALWRLLG